MKSTRTPARLSLLGLALGLALPAAADDPAHNKADMFIAPRPVLNSVSELIAVVVPASGSKLSGTVIFRNVDGGVEVTAKVSGFEPNTEHGFHVHEYGNITAADGTSTGGHYNPERHDHGLPDGKMIHAGDLGNLKADASGVAEKTIVTKNITLVGARNPVIGRSIVIHAKPDDGGQPTGNAGDRIGVGVIGVNKAGSRK